MVLCRTLVQKSTCVLLLLLAAGSAREDGYHWCSALSHTDEMIDSINVSMGGGYREFWYSKSSIGYNQYIYLIHLVNQRGLISPKLKSRLNPMYPRRPVTVILFTMDSTCTRHWLHVWDRERRACDDCGLTGVVVGIHTCKVIYERRNGARQPASRVVMAFARDHAFLGRIFNGVCF